MSRREELIEKFCKNESDTDTLLPLIDGLLFLENQMKALQSLPFVVVHPKQPGRQKTTPAARLYTQLSAQYNSTLRTLYSVSGGEGNGESSPLREWAKNFKKVGGTN